MTADVAKALVGAVLEGVYRIERLLGEGGMGAVFEATHLRLGKRMAVKVMARELAANPEALARFHREAVVTSGLGHPHIVQVFDFSTTPTGEPFLAMEFLEGEDLDHRLHRAGRLPAATVVHITKQVASALAATHAKTIVHRDLKPANIYLLEVAGETDFVKVLDFGISKVRAGTTKLTQSAAVMGTPKYMSPEQALGKVDEIDERTDQWALACIAWECLSGEGPFVGENVPSILFQVVHEPPPTLLPKVPGLHPQVEAILLRALSKNKNDRFPSVDDFAAALETAIVGTAVAAPSGVQRAMQLDAPVSNVVPPRSTNVERTAILPAAVEPSTRAPLFVSGAGHTAKVPADTTFSRATGETGAVADSNESLSAEVPRRRWPLFAVGGVAVAGLALFLLVRLGNDSRQHPATSTQSVTATSMETAESTESYPPEPPRDAGGSLRRHARTAPYALRRHPLQPPTALAYA